MKKKMYDDQKQLIDDCLGYIESSIDSGYSYSQICSGLQTQFYSNYGTLKNLFSDFTPFSLNKYVKRRLLTEAYLKYKQNPCRLNKRDSYSGITTFPVKFRHEFGCKVDGNYSEEELQPRLDLDFFYQLNNALNKFSIINDYEFKGDYTMIETNEAELLKAFISFKSFFMPADMAEELLSQEEDLKILFLEMTTRVLNGNKQIPVIDEVHRLISSAKLYDFNKCDLLGNDLAVFSPEIPQNLYEVYASLCDKLLPSIKSVIPRNCIPNNSEMVIHIISDAETFESIASQIGIKTSAAKELVWYLLNQGTLRYIGMDPILN